jgi:hypothetical protein
MAEYFNYRLTEDAILYFSNLFETSRYIPEKGKPGDPRYNLKLLLSEGSADLEELLALTVDAYGKSINGEKNPFTTGAELIHQAIEKGKDEATIEKMRKTLIGKVQFKAHATAARPPLLGCWVNGKATNLTSPDMVAAAKDKFYPGVLVRAEVSLQAYSEFGGGVTAYFNSVFSQGRGDRIGGQNDATAFSDLVYKAHLPGSRPGQVPQSDF